MRSPAFHLSAYAVLARVSPGCPPLTGRFPSVTHPSAARQHVLLHLLPLDLHVLGTPPAFNLSQDQTLHLKALRPIKLTKRHPNKPYWLNSETHRRSWLRQRTDASPHTNYLFQFLKSVAFWRRCRCAVARQKRNSKLLRSFRQPLRFSISRCRRRPDQLPSNQFYNRHPLRRGRILLSHFFPSTPSNVLFFEALAVSRSSFFAVRFSPAPTAKRAHLTVWLQGVNTLRKIFSEGASSAKNVVISSPRRKLVSLLPREFARARARLEGKFFEREVLSGHCQEHSNLLGRDRQVGARTTSM